MLVNRYRGDDGNDCLLTIDCTDCEVQNQNDPAFSSFKFHKRSALRYELGVCIQTGDLCWISGGWPAGRYADVTIFRNGLINNLDPYERVEADDGYIAEAPERVRCPRCITTPLERKRMMAIVRMRHETINRRVKQWRCLKSVFRHELDLHTDCFTAVCVLTQIAISNGEPLFQVDYSDNLDVSEEESSGEEEESGSEEEEEENGSADEEESGSDQEEDSGTEDSNQSEEVDEEETIYEEESEEEEEETSEEEY